MILGVDASNIRRGGGVTHLVQLLGAADPLAHGFSRVIVWSGRATLDRIEDRPWLVKSHQALLDRRLQYRMLWQRAKLSPLARAASCDVLFVPGGSFAGDFRPVVAMSQNLLPFEWCEARRYGWSWMTVKCVLLRAMQARTFRRADGVVFLSRYASDAVKRVIRTSPAEVRTIPHGIDEQFVCPPRPQLPITRYTGDQPFRILYVSIVDVYKHQWRAAEAVARLRESGLPVTLDLIGPAYPPALKRLRKTLRHVDPDGRVVKYRGSVPYAELPASYAEADMFLFASSCENLPIILLEAMTAGLPIVASNRGPMPEVLGDAGGQFDPEDPEDIARAIQTMALSPALRAESARASFERAQVYSWRQCAEETFRLLSEVASSPRRR